MATKPDPLPPEVRDAIARGDALEAIKLLRRRTGVGLKEAKHVVEHGGLGAAGFAPASPASTTLSAPVIDALRRGDKIDAIKLLRSETGLGLKEAKDAIERSPHDLHSIASMRSPGEVPRSSGAAWWLVAAVVLALFVYFAIFRATPS